MGATAKLHSGPDCSLGNYGLIPCFRFCVKFAPTKFTNRLPVHQVLSRGNRIIYASHNFADTEFAALSGPAGCLWYLGILEAGPRGPGACSE